jgi:hypothetical protein
LPSSRHEAALLLDLRERLTPADHQTHRRYRFQVPAECRQLRLVVSYAPKWLPAEAAARLTAEARRRQAAGLAAHVGARLAEQWSADLAADARDWPIPNLVTISLDDALGAYRGAGHRHAPRQDLVLGVAAASPGLVPGPLPPGAWTLTLSAHTLVSPQCDVSIQIGAETAASAP